MLTRAQNVATPARIVLWRQGEAGAWKEVGMGAFASKVTEHYDIFCESNHVYVAAWHCPEYNPRLNWDHTSTEPLEIGVWSLNADFDEWRRVLLPPGALGDYEEVSAFDLKVFLLPTEGVSARPVLACATQLDTLSVIDLLSLLSVPIE